MKVLFLYPEHYLNIGIPGGISILSACLKKNGHLVDLVDTTFMKTDPDFDARTFDAKAMHQKMHGGLGDKESDTGGMQVMKTTAYSIEDLVIDDPVVSYAEEFQSKIDAFKPDLIAISSMTSTFDFAMDLLRSVTYDCKVIVGGIHATIASDDVMSQPEVDIACYGEADEVFVELCNLMDAGRDYTNVKSMIFRMPDGTIKRNPSSPRVNNEELPCPDWGLFDKRHLFRPFDGEIYAGSFYSQSRGCPMKCTYCVDPTVADMTGGSSGYFRQMTASTTIKHITELKEKFGATWFKFTDDSFLLPSVEHLKELAEGLKGLGIKFGCSVMPNTITEEKVKIAVEMGCVAMSVGVESGNELIRKKAKRNYKNDSLVERLKIVQDHGIRLSTFNIIGFPEETRENVFETINLNRRIGTSACNVYILFPYPGTPIQIEYNVPIRGEDGKILPVSKAKNLGLSKMTPDELEGLLHTFNLYLHAPKQIWPIINLAESSDSRGLEIRGLIKKFLTEDLSRENIDTVSILDILCENQYEDHLKNNINISRTLSKIYYLEFNDIELHAITSAIYDFYENKTTYNSLDKEDETSNLIEEVMTTAVSREAKVIPIYSQT